MFEVTPAIAWLERDYDTAMALTWQNYPETGTYGGLRHFEARGRWDNLENECIGLMFSLKTDDNRKPMTWTAKRPHWQVEAWRDLPLDDEVQWL